MAELEGGVESLRSLYGPLAERIVKSERDYVNAAGRAHEMGDHVPGGPANGLSFSRTL
jgi:hypothetical protein